jgi:hypothetical protein
LLSGYLVCVGIKRVRQENGCAAANQKRNNERHDTTPATKRYVFGVALFQDRVVGLWKWFRGGDHFVASVTTGGSSPAIQAASPADSGASVPRSYLDRCR